MTSSDDESELVPKNVSDYEFISVGDEPISFAKLPVKWNKDETCGPNPEQIFLSGRTDNGLRRLYKQVIAWKFDLSYDKPEISVLSVEGYWIKLLKPRKPYQDIIRTIQITVHFLHFVKWNPQRSKKALSDHLIKAFSMFERRPSVDDLADHFPLIDEAVKRDETLVTSKLLSTCLEEKSKKTTVNEDVKPPFIVDVVNENDDQKEFDMIDEDGDDDADEDDCFDSVCSICDNGGNLYICDGKCMRSFHATIKDGEESLCESLGFSDEELEAMRDIPFYCKNCEYKQHQCFACGKLGSSDESSGCEVFCCVNGACGLFYHPFCVAKLLHPGDKTAAEEHQQKIAAGEQFACPAHKCHVCKELEVRSNPDLQFAVCRRCPRSYHKKCLPRSIAFEKDVDEERGIVQRAWEDLIPNRVLIYCLKHEIDPHIATPVRDHIKFPGPQRKKIKNLPIETSKRKDRLMERSLALDDDAGNRDSAKPPKRVNKVSSNSKQGDLSKGVQKFSAEGPSKKQKMATKNNSLGKLKVSTTERGEVSLGEKLYSRFCAMEPVKSSKGGSLRGEHDTVQKVKPPANRINDSATLDADTRKSILNLVKEASSSITLEQVKGRHKPPSTHVQHSKFSVDNVTLGKVEGSVKAVRAAMKKLDEGGSVLDAKAVCGNDLLVQVLGWKDKLRVYLAPFLHGMRYTSFGRHFTKIEKLKEIVDMLHWYLQDGDMLVDFCCGSNDFSCFTKKKLDEMGKKCSFKNYDILQPKNDFNFEQRDWMKVRPDELPDGSQLIMGLNPPFGVQAALANKFINKALEFKPKLLILIVPRETQRLDGKDSPYDLIWEDDQMCAGKSFYLPGSVDVNDKQIEDWNLSAPVLYLWSRPDWTPKHKAIAEQHGHPSIRKNYRLEESSKEMHVQAVNPDKFQNQEQEGRVTTSHQLDLPCDSSRGNEGETNWARGKNDSEASSRKFEGNGKRKRQTDTSPLANKSSNKGSMCHHLVPHVADRSSLEAYSPKLLETPRQVHSGRDDYQQLKSGTEQQVHSGRDDYQQLNSETQQQVHSGRDDYRQLNSGTQEQVHSGRDDYQQLNSGTQQQVNSGRDDYQQLNRSNLTTHQPYPQAGGYNRDQSVDHLVRKYSLNGEDPVMTSRQAYTRSTNPSYSLRGSADRPIDYPEGRANTPTYRSYMGEMIQEFGRDTRSTVQPHVNVRVREEPNSWNQRMGGPSPPGPVHEFQPPYMQLNPAALPTYNEMNTSAMQRYAPRLNELNHSHMGTIRSPPLHNTIGVYRPPAPWPGTLGFAPGPYRPHPHQDSSGWLNE